VLSVLEVVQQAQQRPPKEKSVTTQDFTNFWGKIFVFVLLEMIEISQGFKTF
jgi:hypothetical protein